MDAIDFMDPRQRHRHTQILIIGYVLIGVAILLLSTILLFVAYGFGYKNGQVIQNGLVFISSTPSPAQIRINGSRFPSSTNARIVLPAGVYTFQLNRSGYRQWQRSIIVDGGQVAYYQYPFLIPTTLTTSTVRRYDSAPSLVTQSPDRRWLLISRAGSLTSFDVYDLNNPKQAPTTLDLPSDLFSPATASQNLSVMEWSNDNTHVLLKHTYDGSTEYVLVDRDTPAQSENITKTLSLPTANVDLRLSNRHFDQYWLFDTAAHTLSRMSLDNPTPQPYVDKVLAYTSYSNNTILYATPDTQDTAKVAINLFDGSTTSMIRHAAANTTYLLDLTTYSGQLYVAIAASSENVEYIYQDPAAQITNPELGVAVPLRVFHTSAPTYLSFSANAQYIMFENASNFAVYDLENQQGYSYVTPSSLDAPQPHASWMDGARLTYVSNGHEIVYDYDGTYAQMLTAADAKYLPIFDQNYKFLYTLVPSATAPSHELLTKTSLRTPADS